MTPTYVTSVPQTQVVAAVQYSPTLFDVRANLATALQLTFEASGKGARLIVLPELAIGGAVMNSVDEAVAVCQEADGYQTSAFLPLAQQFNCHIVFGYVEVNEGKLYNSAAVVGPMGLVANARKHNLYGSDQLWAQPAEDPAPVVITPAGRLGVLICRDVSNKFRESYAFYDPMHRFYKRGSVDTIALITNWGAAFGFPDSAWVELVEETRANLVVSNRCGQERDMKYKGGSAIIDRDRRIWTNGSSFTNEAVVGGVVIL